MGNLLWQFHETRIQYGGYKNQFFTVISKPGFNAVTNDFLLFGK